MTVLAERWRIKPSLPETTGNDARAVPLWSTTDVAPPSATLKRVSFILTMPERGPDDIPWSIGTMTKRPFLPILSSRICLPKFILSP